ncbi:hypothetical protein PMAYCL1PPCAC_19123 [Pristionchus mayeri]|uniref:Uncharacterized protein n=1 Tax=Pristionchus mayeri TaxID=1317129 RepID=A0AAN5I208_9BILA|nr:hypothetical protein PMAYCL1PPCAC_19123 [Pristionchus mayeri]
MHITHINISRKLTTSHRLNGIQMDFRGRFPNNEMGACGERTNGKGRERVGGSRGCLCSSLGQLFPVFEETLRVIRTTLGELVPGLLHSDGSVLADHAQRRNRRHLEVRQILLDLGISELEMEPVSVVVVEVLEQIFLLAITRDKDHLDILAFLLHLLVPSDEFGSELPTRGTPHRREVQHAHLSLGCLCSIDGVSASLAHLDALEEWRHRSTGMRKGYS